MCTLPVDGEGLEDSLAWKVRMWGLQIWTLEKGRSLKIVFYSQREGGKEVNICMIEVLPRPEEEASTVEIEEEQNKSVGYRILRHIPTCLMSRAADSSLNVIAVD